MAGATAERERVNGELKYAQDAARMFCNKHNETATQLAELVDRAQALVEDIQLMLDQFEFNPELSWFEIAHKMKGIGLDALQQWKGEGEKEVGDGIH